MARFLRNRMIAGGTRGRGARVDAECAILLARARQWPGSCSTISGFLPRPG